MSNLILRENAPVSATAITPHATNANEYSMIYVGGAGNVALQTESGNNVTFTAVPAGQYIFVRTRLVLASGTTATLLIGIG